MQDPSKTCSTSSSGNLGTDTEFPKYGEFGVCPRITAESVKSAAYSLGFELVGIAPIGPFAETLFYPKWIERGYAGEMKYLERQKTAKLQPESVLPGARSVIVCAMNYNTAQPYTTFDRLRTWISRYA